jgi:hypothetical protein
MAVARQIGDGFNLAGLLVAEGWLALGQGDLPRARRELEEGLEIARRLGYKGHLGQLLLGLGCLGYAEGDRRQARALMEESVSLLRELGAPGIYDALGFLGYLAVGGQRYGLGVRLLAVAVTRQPNFSEISVFLPSGFKTEREARLAVARAALGEDAFAAAWAEGQALTIEQAVSSALAENDA